MIIVNQYKSIIVNFDNISTIYLNGSGDKVVTALTSHSDEITLGEYATEERAKEVLQEIIENLYPKTNVNMDIDGINFGVQSPIYKMPLE